ncbi:MAG: FAD-linked oxidase C-terminal domain-containing protein, partial [Kiloniellales bacterium]
CSFETLEGAVDAVIMAIQSGLPLARAELLDEVAMDGVNRFSKLNCPVLPTLFFEFHGTERGVAEQAEMLGEIVRDHGGGDFRWATKAEERSKLWQARHDAYYAALAMRPGAKGWATDACVPISRLAECLLESKRDIEDSGLLAPIVGHVGDGNFHLCLIIDPDDKDEMAKAEALNERMVLRTLAMGGTCTGEHGIGTGKMKFLLAEHGEAVSVMRQVKSALDPDNIMNPGKMLRV